jgi:hypothetical protein
MSLEIGCYCSSALEQSAVKAILCAFPPLLELYLKYVTVGDSVIA